MIEIKSIVEIPRKEIAGFVFDTATSYSYPYQAGSKEKDGCSKEAAQKITPKLKDLQFRTLAALFDYGFEGTTAELLAEGMELDPASVKPRLSELLVMGRVEKTGSKGKTRLGSSCAIWRAIETGER